MKNEKRFWEWLRDLEPARQRAASHKNMDEFFSAHPVEPSHPKTDPESDPKPKGNP